MASSKQVRTSEEKFVDGQDESVEDEVLLTEERKEEERRLLFKLDKRILPITCLLYLFACTSPSPELKTSLTIGRP